MRWCAAARTGSCLCRHSSSKRGGLVDFLSECWQAAEQSDLVVFIPTTFFVAEFARMRGIPSVRVALQPMFPTARTATALFGSRDRGALLNRLSYEIPRIASPILWPGSSGFKAANARNFKLGVLPNPMTFRAADSLNLMAYSSALSPDPGDWPFNAKITGAWFYDAEPHLALAPEIEDFLAKGPAIYIGFGSMKWHSRAIRERGVRCDRAMGRTRADHQRMGRLAAAKSSANIMFTGPVHHSLLFPRVCAVVHHGGAGTTAEGLRHARPTLILPQFMDQYDWARRIEELGGGPPPLPMKKVTAAELAARLNDLVEQLSDTALARLQLPAKWRANPASPAPWRKSKSFYRHNNRGPKARNSRPRRANGSHMVFA
jgi:sterol 3beta-glucosyltransferase